MIRKPHITEAMMASLSEQATLLDQDLTPDTVAMMNEGVAPEVREAGKQVLASLDRILNKERAAEEQVDEILDEEEAENPDGVVDDGEG